MTPPEILTPSTLAPELTPLLRSGLNLMLLDRVDSTNRLGRVLADRLATDPFPAVAVLALEQTHGRGRGERTWRSAPGAGMWVSWIGAVDRGRLPTLPSLVGVTLCEALESVGVPGIGLKWPNDLLCARRKLGGILCRSLVRGERAVAVCGVGINLDNPGGEFERAAIGLREAGVDVDLGPLAARCINAVDRALGGSGAAEPGASWRELLDRYSVHQPGEEVAWHDAVHGSPADKHRRWGTFLGFDEAGRLLVEVEGRQEALASGEID